MLNVSIEGDSTASLNNLSQCSFALTIRKFFHIFVCNFLCSSIRPLLLAYYYAPPRSTWPHPFVSYLPLNIYHIPSWSPPPQAEQTQVTQPFLTQERLQVLYDLCGPLLDSFQKVPIFLELGSLELDNVI